MYHLVRPALFSLDAEKSHNLTLKSLNCSAGLLQKLYGRHVPDEPVTVMGLNLPNPVGLAAGLDKDGKAIKGLAALGFGFLEVGTVTPQPQAGNPKPRLFRLKAQNAIINRMGFNNDGVEALCRRVKAANYQGILGINIGKNAVTPADKAVDDYLAGLNAVYDLASYITINISSPNTKGLRDMQGGEALDQLLSQLVAERNRLADANGRYVPLAVKIAPDLDDDGLAYIADRLMHHKIDGVIATNTTIDRSSMPERWQNEAGGLSGRPVGGSSTAIIKKLAGLLDGALPIIGVGGIESGATAVEKLAAGASAVQVYSGLIYQGPKLVRSCVKAIQYYRQEQAEQAAK